MPPIRLEKKITAPVLVKGKKKKKGRFSIVPYQVSPYNISIVLKCKESSTMLRKIPFQRKQSTSHQLEVSKTIQKRFKHFPIFK